MPARPYIVTESQSDCNNKGCYHVLATTVWGQSAFCGRKQCLGVRSDQEHGQGEPSAGTDEEQERREKYVDSVPVQSDWTVSRGQLAAFKQSVSLAVRLSSWQYLSSSWLSS